MKKIAIDNVNPGMTVGKSIYSSDHALLLKEDTLLTQRYIKTLKRLGISAIYIKDGLTDDIEIEDVISEETRYKAQSLVKDILTKAHSQPATERPGLIFTQKDIIRTLDDIVNQLISNRNLVFNLSDIRTTDNYTFAHSVNVAILAISTGISLGLSLPELKKLALGAILHDIGKTKVPLNILNKTGKLSSEEFDKIKKHSFMGYELLKKQPFICTPSALIAHQHHERVDGSGYPKGLKGNEIHCFSKIASIVDVYDALVADRPYRKAMQPHQALEILYSEAGKHDLDILQKFVKHIAAYPKGSTVELSNNCTGVVIHNQVGFPTRPKVRVFFEGEARVNPYEIDLMEKMNVVVVKAYREEEASKLNLQQEVS